VSGAHTRNRLSYLLFDLPGAAVVPHADALVAARLQDGEWGTVALLALVPLAHVDAGPIVDAALASDDTRQREGGVAAVCNGDADLAAPRLDRVEALLASEATESAQARAVRTLRRHGRGAAADAWLAGLRPGARERTEREAARLAWDGVDGGCRP
jgi:hypothetical protein